MLKNATILSVLACLLWPALLGFQTAISQSRPDQFKLRTVVIDPGHGGNDPGNLGTGRYKSREKDVVLDVSMRVGDLIKKSYPDIKVMYTRTTDVFVTLDARAQMANTANADIFISIHCNAAKNPTAMGTESFVLGLHRTEENLEVAMKENSVILLEDDHEKTYEGFDPNSAESIIAMTMMQSAFLDQSVRVSAFVQRQFTDRLGRKDRGVKQAGFLVLRKATMPSILIELGFLTNSTEEEFLNSEEGKDKMALAIYKGFNEYKITVENPAGQQQGAATAVEAPVVEPKAAPVEAAKPAPLAPKKPTAEELAEIEFNKKRKAELEEKIKAAELERQQKLAAGNKAEQAAREQKEKEEKEIARKKAEEQMQAKRERMEQAADAKRIEAELQLVHARKVDEDRLKAEIMADQERLAMEKVEADRLAEEEADRMAQQEAAARETEKQAAAARKAEAERLAEQERLQAEAQIDQEHENALKAKMAQVEEERKNREAKILKEQEEMAANKAQTDPVLRQGKRVNDPQGTKPAPKADGPTAEKAEEEYLQKRREELKKKLSAIQAEAEKQKQSKAHNPSPTNQPTVVETQPEVTPAPTAKLSGTPILKVQILSSAVRVPLSSPQFKGQKVEEYMDGKMYKYTTGSTTDVNEIGNLQKAVRAKGFEGAFAVAFVNGKRITLQEARDMLKK